jgi:UDP-N-acetylmuramoyl-tripeptide--D-alanyl-D-alanine ligase
MLTLREAAHAMHGELHGPDRDIDRVSTDTRTPCDGALFFALKGERFDAARFVGQAFERGAVAAVLGRDAGVHPPAERSLIRVDDARLALGRLAAHWRGRFTLPLIGLTGSNGKTTVKEMIANVLREACEKADDVLATEGNLNNDLGVPLTLLRLRNTHRYAVVEMGMNHAGEIRYLTKLACPDVALVINAGTAHIGLLGSREAIAAAKAEIFEGLSASGIAIINGDDRYAGYWRGLNADRKLIDFGLNAPAAVTGSYRGRALESEIELRLPCSETRFTLHAPGEHNVRNALAAAAVGHALALPISRIASGLGRYRGFESRLERRSGLNGAIIIDDTYNASPESALAAIDVLAANPGKRVLVFGDMGELGAEGVELHRQVGQAARARGIERLYALGELSAHLCDVFGAGAAHFSRIEDLLAALKAGLDADTTLLVKGSRFMQMERVVQSLQAHRA